MEIIFAFIAGVLFACLITSITIRKHVNATTAPVAHWEAVKDDAGDMWRVRWSEKDADGYWLYVRHYGGHIPRTNQHMAEISAEELNRQGRHPGEWSGRGWTSKVTL